MNIITLIKELKKVQKMYGNIDLDTLYRLEVEKKENQFILKFNNKIHG